MEELTFEEFKNIVSAKFLREVWAFEVKTLSHPAFDYCTENVAEFTPTTYYSAKAYHEGNSSYLEKDWRCLRCI